jgi:hypothetical protein
VNIKNHIPVELDLTDYNYIEWHSFFNTVVRKFSLKAHLTSPPSSANRHDPDWVMVDQCIFSWLYNTISKDVRSIICVPKATAYKVWSSIQSQFRDHELHRTVYQEAELHSLVQGDMDIATYTGHLKRLADGLRDLGQPVRDTSQVINMLRGLSPKFHHAVPVITAKKPPHTFLFARSYLLLEEKYDKKHTQTAAQYALIAADCARPPAPAPMSFQGAPHPGQQATGSTSHPNNRGKGKGSNNSGNRPPLPGSPASTHGPAWSRRGPCHSVFQARACSDRGQALPNRRSTACQHQLCRLLWLLRRATCGTSKLSWLLLLRRVYHPAALNLPSGTSTLGPRHTWPSALVICQTPALFLLLPQSSSVMAQPCQSHTLPALLS